MPLQNTLHVFHWNIITGTLVRYSSEKYHPNHILPCTFTGYSTLKRKSKHQSRAHNQFATHLQSPAGSVPSNFIFHSLNYTRQNVFPENKTARS